MSNSNLNRQSLVLPNVDIFTFGESTLFGYESLNHCLIVYSLNEINNLNDKKFDRLHLSSSPTSPVRRLILNADETILALISDKTAYLVYLPQLNPNSGSRLCPINEIPSYETNSSSITNTLIDFLWINSQNFLVVNSHPSSSECHLYVIRPSNSNGIEFVQTFSVGLSSLLKGKPNTTPNKKISLNYPSDIVKLDLLKRKQHNYVLILIFALKSDGDIFILEINQNQFLNNGERISSEFIGPVRILPQSHDNYGADYSHSNLLCLSNNQFPLIILKRNKSEVNECILINSSDNEYSLYTINSIKFHSNENNSLKEMIKDKINGNIYYICDSLSNIYLIEIFWINQIQSQLNPSYQTNIQHLIKSNYLIQSFHLIQSNNKGQWLAIIAKTQINQQKELILIRPHSFSLCSSIGISSKPQSSLNQPIKSDLSSEFVDRIRTILHHDESIPHVTISSSSTNLSNSDFETNLVKYLRIFQEDYIEKQEKVRLELENKQRYLYDFHQTQLIANQELLDRFTQIQQTIQILNQKYQQEYSRRKQLTENVDDLLSIIEERTPVVSNAEVLMQQQLERYQIQINSLQEKILLLKQFLSNQPLNNSNQINLDQSSMKHIGVFVQYFKKEIQQMKQQLETIHHNN